LIGASASRVGAFSNLRVIADVTLLDLDAFVRIAFVDILTPTLARVVAGNLDARSKRNRKQTNNHTVRDERRMHRMQGAVRMCVALT
jgi:hypothetical protein